MRHPHGRACRILPLRPPPQYQAPLQNVSAQTPWVLASSGCRGLLLQCCCCSRTSVNKCVCVCAAGWGLHLRTETSGPTSTPSLAFEFYTIRLLIWSWTRMWDFASPCPPKKISPSLRFTSGFRASELPLLTSFLVCFLPPALQRRACMAGMLKLCFVGFFISGPCELRCGLLGCLAKYFNAQMSFLASCVCRGLLLQWCCCSRTSVDELWCATGSGFRGLVCQSNK